MAKMISLASCAPQQKARVLDIAEFAIKNDFIPALRKVLESEANTYGALWIDFAGFDNFRFTYEVIAEEVIQLLQELKLLHRTAFVNLPYNIYEYLQTRCREGIMLTTRFEIK